MEGWTEPKRRELDFKQCLLYLLDHLIPAIAVGVVFAAALAIFGISRAPKAEDPKTTYNKIATTNRSAFYPVTGQVVQNTEKAKLDGTCIVRSELYTDFSFSTIEGSTNADYNTLIYRFQQDSVLRFLSDSTLADIVSEINSRSYTANCGSVTVETLRWQINAAYSGLNILQYSVTDVCARRALDIAEMLNNAYLEETKTYESIDSAKLIEAPAVFFDMTDVSDSSVGMRTVIKYGIIGGALGVILVFGVLIVIFIIRDNVRTLKDLEYLDLDLYGRIPKKNSLRETEYKRIAYNLILENSSDKILIVPVDGKTNADELAENVSKELSAHKNTSQLIKAESVKKSPEALLTAADVDGIVLVATYGVSAMADVEYSKAEMSKTGKEICGVVLIGCKHS